MGLMNIFKKKTREQLEITEEKGFVYQPASGEVITLEEIGDGVFSAGILGKGCGLKPDGNCVYAPISGMVSMAADTGHAVGVTSEDGLELLIHIGLDTVAMNGKGFKVNVKPGDKVKAGEALIWFDREEIAAAGYQDTIAVLVANSAKYKDVELLRTGNGIVGEKLLRIYTE